MANDACLCKPVAARLRVPDLLARPVCPPAVLTGKQDEKQTTAQLRPQGHTGTTALLSGYAYYEACCWGALSTNLEGPGRGSRGRKSSVKGRKSSLEN